MLREPYARRCATVHGRRVQSALLVVQPDITDHTSIGANDESMHASQTYEFLRRHEIDEMPHRRPTVRTVPGLVKLSKPFHDLLHLTRVKSIANHNGRPTSDRAYATD